MQVGDVEKKIPSEPTHVPALPCVLISWAGVFLLVSYVVRGVEKALYSVRHLTLAVCDASFPKQVQFWLIFSRDVAGFVIS